MRNRLFIDEIISVGGVTAGDNPLAKIAFWKSQEARENHDTPEDVSTMITSAGSANAVTGAQMDLSAIESDELRKSIEDALAEKDSQISELSDELSKLEPEPDPVQEAPDEVKAILKEYEEKQEKLEKELAKERETRRAADFTKRAESLKFIAKTEDLAPVLDELEAAAPEAYETLEKALRVANTRVETAMNQGLFKELGTEEGAEADYEDRRDAWVEKNRKDDESVHDARLRFLKSEEGRIAKEESRS